MVRVDSTAEPAPVVSLAAEAPVNGDAAPPVTAPARAVDKPPAKLLGGSACNPTSPNVSLRVADPRGGARLVQLPRTSFDLSAGRPTRLAGPNATIISDRPLFSDRAIATLALKGLAQAPSDHRPSNVAPQEADGCGAFDGDATDLAQTTSFYAAERVNAWAVRSGGQRLVERDEPLPIAVHAWVTNTPATLNATFDLVAGTGVMLGTYGDVRDGRPVPYTGVGVPFLPVIRDAAPLTTARGLLVAPEEHARRIATLDQLDALLMANRRDEALALIDDELKREPPRQPTSERFGDDAVGKAMRHLAGRHIYFATLELSAQLVSNFRAVTNAYYATATDHSIAAHEVGHAVLDRIKPSLATPAGLAFHEAFSDLAAIATKVEDDDLARSMLAETSGDLHLSNTASRIGDGLEAAVRASLEGGYARIARDATARPHIESFGGSEVLTTRDEKRFPQAHDVSRIVSSAVYELFASRVNARLSEVSESEQVRLVQAIHGEVSAIVFDSTTLMPEDGGTLEDVASAMLAAANNYDRASGHAAYEPELRAIFSERGISPTSPPASMRRLPSVTVPPETPTTALLAVPAIDRLVSRWSPPDGALGPRVEDATTPRGLRVVRLLYRRAEGIVLPPKRATWSVALTFDATGKLVAASAAPP